MRSHEELVATVQFDEDYQQHLDSLAQHENNLRRISANGSAEYIEIETHKQTPAHESTLKKNGFTFSFRYDNIEGPDENNTINVWVRPAVRTLQRDIEQLN